MTLRSLWLWLLGVLGCGYADTYTPAGTPNFRAFPGTTATSVPGVYRTGLPPSDAAWQELRELIGDDGSKHVTRVVLHDRVESDEAAAAAFGWNVVWAPLVPEDDKPLTVLVRPRRSEVEAAVQAILDAHARGDIVIYGCVHGRDRTGVVSGLVGMRLLGWSKEQAWDYAVQTGLRWELPGLDAYWIDDVSATRH